MAHIRFTRNIQRHVQCSPADVPGETVRQAIEAYFQTNQRARGYVLDDQGALRKHMAIFINSTQIRDRVELSDPIATDDIIDIMQALSGG